MPGINQDENNLNNIIILQDEEGNDLEFELIDLITLDNEEYVILLPPDDDMVVILKVENNSDVEGQATYVAIDDDETLNTVFEIFKEKFESEFNFAE